jgi:hypothetical protein
MALPIAPTPKLNNKETKRFMKEVEEGLKKPARLIPTPKLKEAEELIDRYNHNRKK